MARVQKGRRMALRVLSKNPVRSIPVDVTRIAERYAHVIFDDLGENVSGMLVPLPEEFEGRKWAIVVHRDHSPVRKRFSVAHELGHLLIHGYESPHADSSYQLRIRETVRYRDSTSSEGSTVEEIEANQFAAELLMPERAILDELARRRLEYAPQDEAADDKLMREIADKFQVSQQALAIRISNLLG